MDWLLDMPGAISIHSLRVEGDSFASPQKYEMRIFQSTPSVWRETGVSTDTGLQGIISIHSLRVEGDAFGSVLVYTLSNFNPLPPCGGRPRQ